MPRGDKSAYTDRQKRKAQHIEEGYEDRGVPQKEAQRRAWATVNKDDGGGKKSGSGRGKKATNKAAKKDGRIGGKRAAAARKKKASAGRKGAKKTARKSG
jgi:plasmid stabilization system protein ParE